MSSAPFENLRPLPMAQSRVVSEPRNITVDVFRALADPVRLELLAHVAARGPICVCHLEEALPYTQSRISKHLGILRRAGLLASRREGNWVYYSVAPDGLSAANDFLTDVERSVHVPHLADTCAEQPAQAVADSL